MEKDHSFMLFGHSIKMETERMNVVSSVKPATFFFELIKIDKEEENDSGLLFKKDDCARKMIDFMGCLCSSKECPGGRIGSKKRRRRISTCDDHIIPCWPTLHKKPRTVRTPNTTTSCTTSALVPLPVVNYAKENHAVNNTLVLPNHHQLVVFGDHEDPWKIKKILKKSDVNGSSRLLIGTNLVSRHILPHVWRNTSADFDDKKGTEVVIWDMDTGSRHKLTLRRWISKSFVFVGGWTADFVKRRNLMVNDEIGLKWDDSNSMLEFTLLRRNQ